MTALQRVINRLLSEGTEGERPTAREMAVAVHVGNLILDWQATTRRTAMARSGVPLVDTLPYISLEMGVSLPAPGTPKPDQKDLADLRRKIPTVDDALKAAQADIGSDMTGDEDIDRKRVRSLWPTSAFNMGTSAYRSDIVPPELFSLAKQQLPSAGGGRQQRDSLGAPGANALLQSIDNFVTLLAQRFPSERDNIEDMRAAIEGEIRSLDDILSTSPRRARRGRVRGYDLRESTDFDDFLDDDPLAGIEDEGGDTTDIVAPSMLEPDPIAEPQEAPSSEIDDLLEDARIAIEDLLAQFSAKVEDLANSFDFEEAREARTRLSALTDAIADLMSMGHIQEARRALAAILSEGSLRSRPAASSLVARILGKR